MQACMDKFGRVVLPKRLRDDHGLEPGVAMDINEQGECIVLRPIRGEPSVVLRDGLLVYTGKPSGDLRDAIKRAREERLSGLGLLRRRGRA